MNPINFAFDVTNIDVFVGGGATFPTGLYAMAISDMEVRENNGKTGHNLALEYTVTEGEFQGRKYYENLNLWHQTSPGAVEIAMKQLSSIGHAVGVLAGNDLTILANKIMLVDVVLEPDTPATRNPTTGEMEPAKKGRNNTIARYPYDASRLASGNGKPTGNQVPGGAIAAGGVAANAAPAAQAPAMASAAAATQAVPPFTPGNAAPTPTAAAASVAPTAAPPWKR